MNIPKASNNNARSGGGFSIYVSKIPSCNECPFWVRDDNKEYQGQGKFRCMLKSGMSTAQYGGMDIVEQNVRKCPFKLLPCKEVGGKCPECGCGCGC